MSSAKRSSKQLLPTPLSPINKSLKRKSLGGEGGRGKGRGGRGVRGGTGGPILLPPCVSNCCSAQAKGWGDLDSLFAHFEGRGGSCTRARAKASGSDAHLISHPNSPTLTAANDPC